MLYVIEEGGNVYNLCTYKEIFVAGLGYFYIHSNNSHSSPGESGDWRALFTSLKCSAFVIVKTVENSVLLSKT
jgi:hypothetical protein